jgi:hypothetical protein
MEKIFGVMAFDFPFVIFRLSFVIVGNNGDDDGR